MRLLGAMLLVAAVALVVGCGGEERAASEAGVEEFRLTRADDGRQVVAGVLVNPSDETIDSATIEVALYDQPVEPGVAPIETMRVEVRDVGPGERKAFRETVDTRLTLSGAQVRQILVF